jgi:hypothetical protein
VLVVAPANRHTWKPDRATTFEACEALLQELVFPLPDEPPALLLLLPEQAATASPSAAVIAADMVTLPIVLTRVYPLLV